MLVLKNTYHDLNVYFLVVRYIGITNFYFILRVANSLPKLKVTVTECGKLITTGCHFLPNFEKFVDTGLGIHWVTFQAFTYTRHTNTQSICGSQTPPITDVACEIRNKWQEIPSI